MNLVLEYVSCMDELSRIHDLSMQKVEFLENLNFYKSDDLVFDDKMSAKIRRAIVKIRKDNENLPRLILDLKSSLDVVFDSRPFRMHIS